MALSKDWLLKNVRGILRTLCNKLSLNDIEDLVLNDFIHLSVCSIAEQLNAGAYPDYGTTVTPTTTGAIPVFTIDLSTYRIESITKLSDATNGEVIKKDVHEIENVLNIPQGASNVYYNIYGNTMYLRSGSAVSALGALTLSYIRTPTKATADTDYIVLRDKYMDLLVAQAKIMVYEQSSENPPEALLQAVQNNIATIRKNNISELQAIKAKEAK